MVQYATINFIPVLKFPNIVYFRLDPSGTFWFRANNLFPLGGWGDIPKVGDFL